ncbi:MAG: FkbM family methyltransferase [Bdellovibrionales bacterium]
MTDLIKMVQGRVYNLAIPYYKNQFSFQISEHPITPYGNQKNSYFLDASKLNSDSIIYSCGVGNDISFDLDLIQKKSCKIFAFDPTDSCVNYLKTISLPEEFIFEQIGVAGSSEIKSFRHLRRKRKTYLAATLLSSDTIDFEVEQMQCLSIKDIMKKNSHSHIDVLKMDIEGGEYETLEKMFNDHIFPTQIAFEFHPIALNENRNLSIWSPYGWKKSQSFVGEILSYGYQIVHQSKKGTELSLIKKNSL